MCIYIASLERRDDDYTRHIQSKIKNTAAAVKLN